jgi:hypothetical protein
MKGHIGATGECSRGKLKVTISNSDMKQGIIELTPRHRSVGETFHPDFDDFDHGVISR